MKLFTACLCVSLVLAAPGFAQETNSPGASLTSNGQDPSFVPFMTSSQGSMALEVQGAPNSPFALFVGQRATTPICPPTWNGECFELEVNNPSIPVFVLVDGFMGHPFGFLDSTGEARFAFPAANLDGLDLAFQAAVADPGNPPVNFSLSAVCEYQIRNTSTFSGDDVIVEYHFPSGTPYRLYGQNFTSITVSTNGWVKMGGGCTFSDFSELNSDFFGGTVGGAPGGEPVIAAYWDDLDLGNSSNQEVRIREVPAGSGHETRITWFNADLFPTTPLGTIELTIRSNGTIEIDHTGVNLSMTGIVGISSGENAGGTTISNHDFYNAGSIPNTFNSFSFKNTIYRNYSLSGPDTPSGLYTLCFQPQNDFGAYDMVGVIIGQACL